jgi:hypothetical protein
MPLENILVPCMPLAPHVIDTKKYTYMSLSGTQGMSIKSDGISGIFSFAFAHIQDIPGFVLNFGCDIISR